MIQVAHVFLMIVCLLWCPMRCMGALSGRECAQVSQRQVCSCCGHCDEQQRPTTPSGEDRQPENPADDCGCGSCLCHGAVVAGTTIDVADSDGFSYVTPLLEVDIRASISLLLMASHSQHPCHFPPLASGRKVCALTCALLL